MHEASSGCRNFSLKMFFGEEIRLDAILVGDAGVEVGLLSLSALYSSAGMDESGVDVKMCTIWTLEA
jgi:hypothetical protein